MIELGAKTTLVHAGDAVEGAPGIVDRGVFVAVGKDDAGVGESYGSKRLAKARTISVKFWSAR